MSYYPSRNFILLYSFRALSTDRNFEKMIRKLQELISICEKYAKDSEIELEVVRDTFTYEEEIGINLHFKIQGNQDSVLGKVSSLFRFAELQKLGFCNQTFLTE